MGRHPPCGVCSIPDISYGKASTLRGAPSRLESVNHMLNDVGIRYWGEIKGQNEFDIERSNELTPKRIAKWKKKRREKLINIKKKSTENANILKSIGKQTIIGKYLPCA